MKKKNLDIIDQNSIFGYITLATFLILLIPLFLTVNGDVTGWNWLLSDFIVMGIMLFGTGSAFILIARRINKKYRIVVGMIFLILFFSLWA